jgi:hypothetical protein
VLFRSSQVGGSGGVVAVQTNAYLSYLGVVQLTAGQSGANGGGPSGGGITLTITLPVTGGASGAGASSVNISGGNGGNITGTGLIPTILGGVAVGANGGDGYATLIPNSSSSTNRALFFTGGAGTAAYPTGIAGTGGNGQFGSGGGGGGAGGTNGGGGGGAGGNGIVIITCW